MLILLCLFQTLFPSLHVLEMDLSMLIPRPSPGYVSEKMTTFRLLPSLQLGPFMACLGWFEPAQHLLPSLQGFYLDHGCQFIVRQLQRLQSLEGSGFSNIIWDWEENIGK